MKHYTLILVVFLSIGNLFSQTTVSGYYIDKNTDTINAQIKMENGLFGQLNNAFTKEIIILNNNGDSKIFIPVDIKGYGFTLNGIKYRFLSKPTRNGSNKFLTPVIVGPKTSLYQYGINYKGSGSPLGSNQVFYTLEKSDGTYLFLKAILNKKFKKDLKDFYKENIEAQNAIDSKFKYWLELEHDLNHILRIVNKS